MVGGDFLAVNRDSVASNKFAGFAFAAGKTSGNEGVYEASATGGWKALSEQFKVGVAELGEIALAEEQIGELGGLRGGIGAVNNGSDLSSKAFLAAADTGVLLVRGEDLVECFGGDESEVLEVVGKGVVGLVEPELVEVENAGFGGIKPNGVAFGLAEFAAGDFVDNEWARVGVGLGVFEALDEVDARGAVAVLVGAAELQVDLMRAEKMQEIIALNKGVAELGVRNAGAAGADAVLDKLAVEQLGHAKSLADFAEEGEEFDVLEPVVIVENFGLGGRVCDTNNLSGESLFVVGDFVEALEVALFVFLGVANLAGGAADEVVRSIAMAHETSAHHQCGEVANMEAVGTRVGAPIEIPWSFV